MNRLPRLIVLLALFVAPGSALSEISVRDDLEHEVSLPHPAKRILTLSPHATEMLLAIGAKKKIIAAAQFFDYPQSMQDIPQINTLGRLDRERILTYDPDLVIAWASGNHPGDLQWLRESGLPVYMSEPENLSAIASSLTRLGVLIGEAEKGKQAAENFTRRISNACRQRRNSPVESAYYEIWPAPPMSIGGRHWLNQILQLAHLRNVFAAVPRAVFTRSAESLLANPAQVIITAQAATHQGNTAARILLASPALGRPGPRIAEGLEQLCSQL